MRRRTYLSLGITAPMFAGCSQLVDDSPEDENGYSDRPGVWHTDAYVNAKRHLRDEDERYKLELASKCSAEEIDVDDSTILDLRHLRMYPSRLEKHEDFEPVLVEAYENGYAEREIHAGIDPMLRNYDYVDMGEEFSEPFATFSLIEPDVQEQPWLEFEMKGNQGPSRRSEIDMIHITAKNTHDEAIIEFDEDEKPPFGELISEGADPELEELTGSYSAPDSLDPGENITTIYQFERPSGDDVGNRETYEYSGEFSYQSNQFEEHISIDSIYKVGYHRLEP